MPTGGRDEETELRGGTANRGRVTRVGATVRRPQGPGSDAVHALLRHLEERGFAGAPRHLGEDAGGREVLSYVEGEVPIRPTPAWAHEDSALVSVGVLLRRFHEAVADFDPTPLRWRTRVPDRWRRGVVSHNDPNLDNVVFRDGEAVALIDFDLASPGCLAWDLATAARSWVPLIDPRDVPPALAGRAEERLRLLLDAAGADEELRADVVAAVLPSLSWGYDVVRDGAAAGNEAYADYWTRAQQRYLRGVAWLEDNADLLRRAALRR